MFQRRHHHLHSEHTDLLVGRLRHILHPGPYRSRAGHSRIPGGQEWSRARFPDIPGGGSEASRRSCLGSHLLLHAGGECLSRYQEGTLQLCHVVHTVFVGL